MRLLVVGRLSGQLGTAVRMAIQAGAKVAHVETSGQATAALRNGQGADLMMVDYELDIRGLIEANEAERIMVPVVACGIGADPQKAADAIRQGAQEFIPLPPEAELIAAVLAAVAQDDRPMVTQDAAMQSVMKLADQVAASEASILITGESGVGKEVMARYVHAKSRRADKVFISVNCAAIPENLLEAELFGYERGAFTGAVKTTPGKIEQAQGGTLFLDEVGDIPLPLQVKLLRFLQERVIERIGGRNPIPVDTRVVCATHQNLEEMIAAGTFREDLYYRLAEIIVRIPNLAERPGDAVLLAKHFLGRFAREMNPQVKGFAPGALAAIEQWPWPGNVRELENRLKRAVIMAEGKLITAEDLDLQGDEEDALAVNLKAAREAADRSAIRKALAQTDNNISNAAKLLGISRPTLYDLMKQYDLQP
jgi:putative PEP-CTERM system response regulator